MRRWGATLLVFCLVATGTSAFAASPREPTLDEAQALWLINVERARAGLPPAGYHSALAAAAKAHADFVTRYYRDYEKYSISHHLEPLEWQHRKGWTGVTSQDRAIAQGYDPEERQVDGVGENISWDGTDGRTYNPLHLGLGQDELFNTLWHRFSLLSPRLKELGAGWSSARWLYDPARFYVVVVDMGFGKPSGRYVVRYPATGQDNVPTTFGGSEIPDPLRGTGVDHAGYPISLTFSDPDFGVRGAKITQASLVEKGGRSLPLLLYDMNYRYVSMGPNVAIMAKQPLKPGTTYIVHIRGVVYGSGGQRPFDERWYFRTQKVPAPKTWTTGPWRFTLGDATPMPDRRDMPKLVDLETARGPMNIIPKNVDAPVFTTVKGRTVPVKDSKPPFSDVGSTAWAAPSIYVTWAMGWLDGRSAGRFVPRGTLTEAEAAQALYRIAGEPRVSATGAVPPGTPKSMEKAVAWAAKNLARGEPIVPGRAITRSKFVAWTVRTLLPDIVKLPARSTGFRDDSSIPAGHKPEVAWAKRVGLAKGTDGRFRPSSSLTRAEAAVLWCRAFVGVGCGN